MQRTSHWLPVIATTKVVSKCFLFANFVAESCRKLLSSQQPAAAGGGWADLFGYFCSPRDAHRIAPIVPLLASKPVNAPNALHRLVLYRLALHRMLSTDWLFTDRLTERLTDSLNDSLKTRSGEKRSYLCDFCFYIRFLFFTFDSIAFD